MVFLASVPNQPRSADVLAQKTKVPRSYLNRDGETYDLIFLDVFAGENVPWYLVTREALQAVQRHLNPGGRLLVNWVTRQNGESDGLRRLEAGTTPRS